MTSRERSVTSHALTPGVCVTSSAAGDRHIQDFMNLGRTCRSARVPLTCWTRLPPLLVSSTGTPACPSLPGSPPPPLPFLPQSPATTTRGSSPPRSIFQASLPLRFWKNPPCQRSGRFYARGDAKASAGVRTHEGNIRTEHVRRVVRFIQLRERTVTVKAEPGISCPCAKPPG